MTNRLELMSGREDALRELLYRNVATLLLPLRLQMVPLYTSTLSAALILDGAIDKEEVWNRLHGENPVLSHDRGQYDDAWRDVERENSG